MQKYIYGDVLIYAVDHTIKEIQEFFCFPSYQACKRYLLEHHIKHLYECRSRQNNNQRTNRLITYNGKTQNLKQWSKELNISYGTLLSRIDDSKWSIEKAFTEPVKRRI